LRFAGVPNSTFIRSIGAAAFRRPNPLEAYRCYILCFPRLTALLGPIADGFDDWLAANDYTRDSRGYLIRMLKLVDADLRRRHVKEVGSLTHLILHDCWRTLIKTYPSLAGTVRTLVPVPNRKGGQR